MRVLLRLQAPAATRALAEALGLVPLGELERAAAAGLAATIVNRSN